MAKVSLRIYNREIENLIDQGGTDEAIAHCRHILKSFSKHLETYRLLGKSYLESHRYAEAVDVFSRVLMSVPDDFVAHVGMSIIRDEENKLDDSIWHMERAFESQPSNAAIQGELQRLYGRRDGMEPPKVRMTRGALAHMYVQGELYPQAIAEVRAVLGQDSQRADMQVLLARAYFKSGQKADASDICTQLVKRYPYCFEANRIMVELLPSRVGASESTETYRMRVGELDPYAAFVKGSVFQSNEVADAAISLERLEYTGSDVPVGREWSSTALGIGLGSSSAAALAATSSGDQPEWLKSYASAEPTAFSSGQDAPVSGSSPQEEIPDFLRSAGWGESSGGPEQPASFFDSSEAPAGGALAPADMPDWLAGQAPAEHAQTFGSGQNISPPAQSLDTPDWQSGLAAGQFSEGQSNETPDWLSGLGGAPQPRGSAPIPPNDAPEWLTGLGSAQNSEAAPAQAHDAPDWLNNVGGAQSGEAVAAESNDAPDWLSGHGREQAVYPSTARLTEPSEPPDWLQGMGGAQPVQPAASLENLGASAPERDDAVAWPESLAAKHGAKPEELVTEPNMRSEIAPDWVEQAGAASQAQPSVPTSIENLGASAQEQDDAVAWLESLAAKHGAKPEELVTDPNKRSEIAPEWVQQAAAASQAQPPVQPAASIENLGASAQEQDDAVAWLESLAAKHGAKPEELVTDPKKRSETPPDWVKQASSIGESQPVQPNKWSENAQNIGEQFSTEFEDASPSTLPGDDATGSWLRGQEEKEKNQFAARNAIPENDDVPDWMSGLAKQDEVSDIPEWMRDKKETVPGNESPVQNADRPDWLDGIRDEPASEGFTPNVQHLSGGDLSDWLSGLNDNPVVSPVAPSTEDRDLPDWLSDVDSQDEKPEDDWKKPIGQVPAAASKWTQEPAPVPENASFPDWLQGVEADSAKSTQQHEDKVPWPQSKIDEAGSEPQLKPTSPSDWQPVEPKPEPPRVRMADFGSRPPMPKPKPSSQHKEEPVYEPIESEWSAEPPAETRKPIIAPAQMTRQPVVRQVSQSQPTVQTQAPAQKPVSPKKSGARASETQPGSSALVQAKEELDRGDIPAALERYGKLIKKGKHLEETIRDLSDSIYRYPVEVGIWQSLGDAYMRANRLKEALEAYNKAEELIR